jgi:hypothetical protein
MARHKKRQHTKFKGKFIDRHNERKARLNSKNARYQRNEKAAQRSGHKKKTFLIGKYKY